MKLKNINVYDTLMENLYYNLNEINQTLYNVMLESNEDIANEMINDLKVDLIESYKELENILHDNQKNYIHENINNIYRSFHTINNGNKIDGMKRLHESLNSSSKNIYIDNDCSDMFNSIVENYISILQQINNSNIDLYRKEYMTINDQLNENFVDIYNNTVTGLMEGLIEKVSELLSKIKNGFGNKHDKILSRDKDWLKSNKKKLLNKDYTGVQLEVVNDYNITFEGLLNRHNIFDKNFINSANKNNLNESLRRFEDKKGDIRNGLDNYFRTGNSKREIGMKKISDDEVKTVVENMISYCESFLAGKKFLDEKIDIIMKDLSNTKIKEATDYSHIFNFGYNPYKVLTLEASDFEFIDDEPEDDNMEDEDLEDDNMDTDDKSDNMEEVKGANRGIRDRQTGVAVLLTVAEERYFDYIQILKGLIE